MLYLYYVLGQIFKGKELIGYRLLSLDAEKNDSGVVSIHKEVKDIPLDIVRNVLGDKITFENAYYKESAGLLVGTQGSLTNYQKIGEQGVFIRESTKSEKKVVILYEIIDGTGVVVGYGVADSYGAVLDLQLNRMVDLVNQYAPSNFKLENRNGTFYAKPLGEKEFAKAVKKDFKATVGYNSKLNEKKIDNHKKNAEIKDSRRVNILPSLEIYSYDDIKNNPLSTSAVDKLYRASVNMKRISPFYYTIYKTIPQKMTMEIDTMGVSETTLYINPNFVVEHSVPEITFVLIHEVLHIVMRHAHRHGKRHNTLWNIATDLYINSIIEKDFGCTYRSGVRTIESALGVGEIKAPDSGVFLSTIGETLDFGVETAETIYNKLYKENKDNLQNLDGSSGQNGKSGQSDSSGQGNTKGRSQKNKQQNSGSAGAGVEDVDSSRSELGMDMTDNEQSKGYKKKQKVSVIYNGKRLDAEISMDITTSKVIRNDEDRKEIEENSLNTTQRVKTAIELEEEKTNAKLEKVAGSGESIVKREIEFGLSKLVNWKVLLKNICKVKPKKKYTLGHPEETYMNRGITVASRQKIGKPEEIKGIKVCVDVSGSVSEQELNLFLSEVNNILSHYKVDGELIYWSTTVGNAGEFRTLRDLLRLEPVSDGGTDVKCVFDYLSRKTRVNGKFESDSLKDIKCVIIITDGCFAENYVEYARTFGNKTIWVITDGRNFRAPFGLVAQLNMGQ